MRTTTRETIAIFATHSWRYKWKIIAIVVGLIAIVFASVTQPLILKRLMDSAYSVDPVQKDLMIYQVYYLVGAHIFIQIMWRSLGFVNNRFQPQLMADLSRTGFNYLLSHSQRFFENNFVGSLIAKLKRYPSSYEKIADVISWSFIPTSFHLVIVVVVVSYYWLILGMIILFWAFVYVGFSYKYSMFKMPFDKLTAAQDTKTTGYMSDVLSNNSNVHLFASREFEIEGFKDVTETLRKDRQRSWDLTTIGEIVQNISTALLLLVTLSLGVRYHNQALFSGAEFIMLYFYLDQLNNKLWEIGKHIRTAYSALADADELTVMMTTPHELIDKPNAINFLVRKGSVSYNNVSFSYPDQNSILKHFSLDIQPGEKVALVGESGAGKSTLVKLLFRYMDVNDGSITIDGLDLRDITQDSLHNAVTLVPQDPNLFHRTLLDNIRYNRPDSSFAEVTAAAKAARCDAFIEQFPDGYDTLVGERGIKLSGGQRQRVAIARAFLRNSPILVLDEATSSLDSESEKYIQEALHNLMRGKTTVVVAHRLSTIKEMDRIIVVRGGAISEEGTHESLLSQGGEYARYWDIQSGGFILNAAHA